MIARRTLLAAAPAVALAPRAVAAPSRDLLVRGSKAYSESAMVMSVAADGSSALTLRFCRFPEEGLTWLWCHLLKDGELFAYTNHHLPCTRDRLAGSANAAYSAPPMATTLVRSGRGASLTDVRLSAALPFHRSRTAPHGAGRSSGRFDGRFTPMSSLAASVREGRDEVYGTLRAEVEVEGRRFVHLGAAKFHEQRQEAPRFEAPFCYSWLAGERAAATTLLVARGATGGWQLDGAEDPLLDMRIDPPGPERDVAWRLKSRGEMGGGLRSLVRYQIPIYDRSWNGSFVRGEAGGRPVVGVANDWITAPDIYAAARLRAR